MLCYADATTLSFQQQKHQCLDSIIIIIIIIHNDHFPPLHPTQQQPQQQQQQGGLMDSKHPTTKTLTVVWIRK